MSKFIQGLLEIGAVILGCVLLGFIAAFSEFSGDDLSSFFICFGCLFILFLIIFLGLYFNYKFKRRAKKYFNQLRLFMSKYPLSTALLLDKYKLSLSRPLDTYNYYRYIKPRLSEYGSVLRTLKRKGDDIVEEEKELNQIVELNELYSNALQSYLKEQKIKTHWLHCSYYIPNERADIKNILKISDTEWSKMDEEVKAAQKTRLLSSRVIHGEEVRS